MNAKNIWELAEGWVSGTLLPFEIEHITKKMELDPAFAAEFNENIQLIQTLNSSGSHKRFRDMVGDIHQKDKKKIHITRFIKLSPNFFKTAAVAAGVAVVTTAVNFGMFFNSKQKGESQYNNISREVEHIKKGQARLQEQQLAIIDSIKKINATTVPASEARYTGTGFAISNDGYFATAYHVINKGKFDSVYILCKDSKYHKASLVSFNAQTDLAIMKVEGKNFKFGKGDIPYSFNDDKSKLGAHIFTLGFPVDDFVYSEGYISARNGFNGNETQYTLELPAGHGQSGSPVVDEKGSVVGMLTAISGPEESNTYAVGSGALLELVEPLVKEGTFKLPKANKLTRAGREAQIEKLENYTFSVKVYKK